MINDQLDLHTTCVLNRASEHSGIPGLVVV